MTAQPARPDRSPSPADGPQHRDGLDFTSVVRRLCEELCRLDELRHVDMARVAVRMCQTRRPGPYGVQATMTPLRFRDGAATVRRRGAEWVVHPVPRDVEGRDGLYLLSLYVPRFLDLSFDEKIAVLVHELWHVSPAFDGDLRRFPGRYHAHGARCDRYHDEMRDLAARWLAADPRAAWRPYLDGDFAALRARFGRILGLRIPTPRLWRADRLPRRGSA